MTRRRVLTLGRAVDRFLADKALEGRQPRGIDTYRRVLDDMLDTLGSDIDALLVDRNDLLDVVAGWQAKGLAQNTMRSRISVLRSFGSWLSEEHDSPDPALRLKRPRRRSVARPRPARDEHDQLISRPGDRDRLVVWLLAMTGIRVSELRSLRWEDVGINAARAIIHGKGGKQRIVPLPRPLRALLVDEYARRAEHGHAEPEHFVVPAERRYITPTGGNVTSVSPDQPCGETSPWKALARACELAGVERISPHQLRRAYADTYLRANPGDIVGLQAVLGHERIDTTRDYLSGVELEQISRRVEGLFDAAAAGRFDTVSLPAEETVEDLQTGDRWRRRESNPRSADSPSGAASARTDEPSLEDTLPPPSGVERRD